MDFFGYLFWCLTPAVQGYILWRLWDPENRQRFASFARYIIFDIVAGFGLLFLVFHLWPQHYYYSYWTTALIAAVLGFFVLADLFKVILEPFSALKDFSRMIFQWSMLVLVILAIFGFLTGGEHNRHSITETFLSLQVQIRVVECGLVLFLVLFSNKLSVSLRTRAAGIALGFGLNAAFSLIAWTLRTLLGTEWGEVVSNLNALAYNLACATWMCYMLKPESLRETKEAVAANPLLQRWNAALLVATASQTAAPAPFVPAIERVVERTLERHVALGDFRPTGSAR